MSLGTGIAIAGIWLGAGIGMVGAALGDAGGAAPIIAMCAAGATFFASLFSS